MTSSMQAPLDMYKANLELQADIARMVQEAGCEWLVLGGRLASKRLVRQEALTATLREIDDWQGLAAWSAGLYQDQLQQRFGAGQEVARAALGLQGTFAAGLQGAMHAWQAAAAKALQGGQASAVPADSAWTAMFAPWQRMPMAAGAGK